MLITRVLATDLSGEARIECASHGVEVLLTAPLPKGHCSPPRTRRILSMRDRPISVLVVEDEALLLFSIADDLRAEAYNVFEASGAD